jgi:ATP-binding cassette subfamily B protein/subfamily B ATP-binding cassette protein MsbA
MVIKHRVLLSALVITGLIAAVLEGGTLGILGLAISVLLEEKTLLSGYFSGSIGYYFDMVVSSISSGGLFLLLVGLAVGAQIFKSAIVYLSYVVQIYLTAELRRDIQRLGTRHVMSMSYAQVSTYPAGTIATLIDQSEVIENLVTQIGNVCRALLMMMAYVAILLWMSITTALGILVLVLIFWFSMSSTVRKLRTLSAEATQGQIDLWRSSVEYLNAPKLLRIFNSTKVAEEVINEARDRQIYPERKGDVMESAIGPAIEVLTILAAGVFLITGYLLGGEGAKAAVPTLFVYVVVFYRLKPIIKVFTDVRTKMARILPPLERVANFLRREGKEFSRTGGKLFSGLKNEIRVNNISFKHRSNDTPVLSNVSFSIKAGQTVALVGESGAGKTTLADLIVGLYEPTNGEILIDGIPLNELHLTDWREHIGVVDQEAFLLNASVRDNIEFARPGSTYEEISLAARAAHAEEFILELDKGYDTVIGDRGLRLSGGQRQRVALARALVRNPEILILDEATSALDSESEKAIQEALNEMHNTRTIVVIAHRLSTIANADHIVVLGDRGILLEDGTKRELLSRNGRFARLWNIQAGSPA